MPAATNAAATNVATSAAPGRRRRTGGGVRSTPIQSNRERPSGRGGIGGSMPTIVGGLSATIDDDGAFTACLADHPATLPRAIDEHRARLELRARHRSEVTGVRRSRA